MNDVGSGPDAALSTAGVPFTESGLLAEFARERAAGKVALRYLDAVRAALEKRHFAGASGTEIVAEFTAAADRLLLALHQWAEQEHARRFPRLNQRLAIVARGGYGRGELNPYSDIDLLFLHDWKPGPYIEVIAEIMLHALWDAGLIVGHATRNVRQCVKLANDDLKEKTASIDARFLAGDDQLYADLEKALAAEVLNRNQPRFFKAKLEESRERHARYGDSVYLLEPQIKEGEGGLRDLHTAMWLAKVKYKVHSLGELVQRAIITRPELEEVRRAEDFLFRVRNSLHFLGKRHTDQLTFEYQEQIAPLLGFRGEDPRAASGELMRTYYQQASTILRFSEGLIARVTEEPDAARFLRRSPGRQIRPGVVIQRKVLAVAATDFFQRDPLNLITIFEDCQAHGVELSGATYQMVRDSLPLIDDNFRRDPQAGAALMAILKGKTRVAETLEAMHRAGVLGALIPEFGNLYARVLHDLYHIYTVDRHSLVAVRELERLRNGEFKEKIGLLTSVARESDILPLLFLALLLHDIGKGHGHDHHERGALLTAEVSQRLGLDPEEVDLVVFLVRNHLAMSQVAQKRDVDDQSLVADFAHSVGSIDRLKALFLMTFADMRAVAPAVYNNWRDMLLSDLYTRALKVLEQGDREAVDPARRLAVIKSSVAEQMAKAGAPDSAMREFLDRMPDRYFLTVPEDDISMHFDLMRSLGDQALVCRQRHFPEREFSEFIVVTRDQPGLFSKIAGVLTANNLNILSARITTRDDGLVLDVFRVAHLEAGGAMAMEEDRWLRVERDLLRVLSGERDIEELVAGALRARADGRKFVARVATEVTVDNRASEGQTVIDVFTQDRVGLLFTITNTLFRLGLIIHLARISTNADQALDVFYVTDLQGRKITELNRLRELSAALTSKLAQHQAEAARA